MSSSRVNQKSIADLLQLSTATVSRSLRNDTSIHPATRARVLEAASKLGYRLPSSSRAHGKRDAKDLTSAAVLIGHPQGFHGDPSSAGQNILAGISDGASVNGVNLTVHFVSPDDLQTIAQPEHQPPAMRAGLISGLVMLYPFPEETIAAMCETCPCVTLVHRQPNLDVDCIDTDQVRAVADLVGHLADLGHRDIGFLTWGHDLSWEHMRHSGYREGLFRHGLPFHPEWTLNLSGDLSNPMDQAKRIQSLADRGVRAWVTSADHVGYAVSRHLQELGVRVGADLAMTGYDGMDPPPDCVPLTTIRVPFQAMGVAAIRRLLRRIHEPGSIVRDVLLRHEMVITASTIDVVVPVHAPTPR